MSWRFRTSFKVIPGVRINLTNRGFSTTIGVAPFSVNIGPHGTHANISIPGTGLSNRIRLDHPNDGREDSAPPPYISPPSTLGEKEEIRSASTHLMNSPALEELRRILTEANTERSAIETELSGAEAAHDTSSNRFRRWHDGFLFKRVFKAAFQKRREEFELATAKRDELREQLQLTTVAMEMHLEGKAADAYFQLRDAADMLSECQSIWDILSRQAVNRFVTRSAASESLDRELVKFGLEKSDLVTWEERVPLLRNKNGGDMYIYPGFILYHASRRSFALIDLKEVRVVYRLSAFIETGSYPVESKVQEYVWEKSNKDGSPDRRFAQNRQFPVLQYGQLEFSSQSGLHEQCQFSDIQKASEFARAWARLTKDLTDVER